MDSEKFHFLKEEFVPLLQTLDPRQMGVWGVMKAQQMVEHFADAVKVASGKLELPSIDDQERIAKNQGFLMTEIPFKENTKNPLLSEIPPSLRHTSMDGSINELKDDLANFFQQNESDPSKTSNNSFFGTLDFDMNIRLLYKHAKHHLKQFGIE